MTRMHFFFDGENFFRVAQNFYKDSYLLEPDPMKLATYIANKLGHEVGEVSYYSATLPHPSQVEGENIEQYTKGWVRRVAHHIASESLGVHYYAPQLRYTARGQAEGLHQKGVDMRMGLDALYRIITTPLDNFFIGTFDSDFLPLFEVVSSNKIVKKGLRKLWVPQLTDGQRSTSFPEMSGYLYDFFLNKNDFENSAFDQDLWRHMYSHAYSLLNSTTIQLIQPSQKGESQMATAFRQAGLPID